MKKILFCMATMVAVLLASCTPEDEGSSVDTDPDHFKIYSVADFYDFIDSVAINPAFNAKLMKNLDLSGEGNWTPIPEFRGSFLGNNKSIKGITIDSAVDYLGLFGRCIGAYVEKLGVSGTINSTGGEFVGLLAGQIRDSTVVENCATLEGSSVTSMAQYTGGLIGSVATSCEVNYCANTATVTASNNNSAGVAGYLYKSTMNYCVNTGDLSSSADSFGGVVGYSNGSTMTYCANSGTITKTTANINLGGIVGATNQSTIDYCENTGSVIMELGSRVGGIVGTDVSSMITNCTNSGSVFLESSDQMYIGGILGYASYSEMKNCLNTGTISSAGSYAGGVLGESYGSKTTSCINKGAVTCTEVKDGVGGVIGFCYGTGSETRSCENYGVVSSAGIYTGGIIGYMNTLPSAYDCVNYGKVYGTGEDAKFVGGVAGCCNLVNQSGTKYVNNCHNYADVEASEGLGYIGGIAGFAGYIYLDGCSNSGAISGTTYIGGLIGEGKYVTAGNCFNTGTIVGSGDYVGGLVANQTNSLVLANSYNLGSVTGVDYVGGLFGQNIYQISNSFSVATVSGTGSNIGGAVTSTGVGDFTNVYYDNEVCTTDLSTLATGSTTAEMKHEDFVAVLNEWVSLNNTGGEITYLTWEAGSKGYPVLVEATVVE
ncbi:MAG: hypothetical protein R3Y38_04030 [Rikenellaceae bacterium]